MIITTPDGTVTIKGGSWTDWDTAHTQRSLKATVEIGGDMHFEAFTNAIPTGLVSYSVSAGSGGRAYIAASAAGGNACDTAITYANELVGIEAVASHGYEFIGWEGLGAKTANNVTTLPANVYSASAVFAKIETYKVVAESSNKEIGKVMVSPQKAEYGPNETITISAQPLDQMDCCNKFIEWKTDAVPDEQKKQPIITFSPRTAAQSGQEIKIKAMFEEPGTCGPHASIEKIVEPYWSQIPESIHAGFPKVIFCDASQLCRTPTFAAAVSWENCLGYVLFNYANDTSFPKISVTDADGNPAPAAVKLIVLNQMIATNFLNIWPLAGKDGATWPWGTPIQHNSDLPPDELDNMKYLIAHLEVLSFPIANYTVTFDFDKSSDIIFYATDNTQNGHTYKKVNHVARGEGACASSKIGTSIFMKHEPKQLEGGAYGNMAN